MASDFWRLRIPLGRVFRRMGLPLWTFLGIGVAALLFNAIGDLIEAIGALAWMHAKPLSLAPAALACLVVILAVLIVAVWINHHPEGVSTMHSRRIVDRKQGLICLVSNADSAKFAIRHHAAPEGPLQHLWLVPSREADEVFGPSTRAVADDIGKWCATELPAVTVTICGVDPGDAQDTFDLVNRIFRSSGLKTRDIVADFTGGVKPMSVGMVMACLPAERQLEYIALNPATRLSSGPYLIDYQHSAFDLIG